MASLGRGVKDRRTRLNDGLRTTQHEIRNTRNPCPTPSFEDLYRELEDTVRKLESGDLPLAESLALFERSTKLAEQCNALLDGAELRVRLVAQRGDGELEARPFEGWQSG